MEFAKDFIKLCDGDFGLATVDGETILYPRFPVNKRTVIKRTGVYTAWSNAEWREFIALAAPLIRFNPDLRNELKSVRNIVNDDAGCPAQKLPVKPIVRYSIERSYIRVINAWKHRSRFRGMGLFWNPMVKAWQTDFTHEKLVKLATAVDRFEAEGNRYG